TDAPVGGSAPTTASHSNLRPNSSDCRTAVRSRPGLGADAPPRPQKDSPSKRSTAAGPPPACGDPFPSQDRNAAAARLYAEAFDAKDAREEAMMSIRPLQM